MTSWDLRGTSARRPAGSPVETPDVGPAPTPASSSLLAWPGTAMCRKPRMDRAVDEPQEPTTAPVTGSRHPSTQPHSCRGMSSPASRGPHGQGLPVSSEAAS